MTNVTIDLSEFEGIADELNRLADQIPGACSRACNRAGDMTVTSMGRTLADETGLGVREVREHIDVERSTRESFEYLITLGRYQTTAGMFDPRETKLGVSARPWGTRRVFPGTFMVRDEVFHRIGKARYPIEPIFGPDLAKQAAEGETIPTAVDVGEEALRDRLVHELQRIVPKGVRVESDDEG